jgi:predicted DNA-binding transcriptional regulator YafY
MNYSNQTDRVIRLVRLAIYIERNPGRKAKELAQKFEVSERNIYRDLRTLDLIIPLVHEKGYRVMSR